MVFALTPYKPQGYKLIIEVNWAYLTEQFDTLNYMGKLQGL